MAPTLPTYPPANFDLPGEYDDDLLRPPRFVQPADLKPGDKIDMWCDRSGGYGGITVVETTPTELHARSDSGHEHRLKWSDYVAVSTYRDGELRPDACLDYRGEGSGCKGRVEYRHPGHGHKSWPRCERHGDERLRQAEETNRRYPYHRPSDFSELDAGERWDDDY